VRSDLKEETEGTRLLGTRIDTSARAHSHSHDRLDIAVSTTIDNQVVIRGFKADQEVAFIYTDLARIITLPGVVRTASNV
jgi:hypothetical protein